MKVLVRCPDDPLGSIESYHPALSVLWHSSVLGKEPQSNEHQINSMMWIPCSPIGGFGQKV